MDWLKSILQSLPLEKISDILGEIVIWWSQLVKGVPPADLPMYAYIGGSIVVLALWILVARMLPKPLGGISWMVLFAVLLAPGTALGDPSLLAPASISVVYAVMMKDTTAAASNALPVLIVLVVGLFIGFVWQLIRGAFESSLDKARLHTAEDAEANMQLASGNYLAGGNYADSNYAGSNYIAESAPLKEPLDASLIVSAPKADEVVKAETSGSKVITTEVNNPEVINAEVINTDTDINLKKAPELKRKKVEGFYSKKADEETIAEQPVIKSDDDNKNDK